MTIYERRRLRSLAEQFPAAREALLSLAGPRKAVKPEKRARLAAKKESREERNVRMAVSRAAVFAETGGKCALCSGTAEHAHHLISGVGARRIHEGRLTLAPLCALCHLKAHNGDAAVFRALFEWCGASGRTLASVAVAHRLHKAEDASFRRRARAAGATP